MDRRAIQHWDSILWIWPRSGYGFIVSLVCFALISNDLTRGKWAIVYSPAWTKGSNVQRFKFSSYLFNLKKRLNCSLQGTQRLVLVIIHRFSFALVMCVCAPSITAVKKTICSGYSVLDHPPFVTSSWWNMRLSVDCLNFLCMSVCGLFFVFVRLQLARTVCQTSNRQRSGCPRRMLNKACQP